MTKAQISLSLALVCLGVIHGSYAAQDFDQTVLDAHLNIQANNGDIQAMRQLLDAGADPNSLHTLGCALFSVDRVFVGRDRIETARVLLQAGASPEFQHILGGSSMKCAEAVDLLSIINLPHTILGCRSLATSWRETWMNVQNFFATLKSAATLLVEYGADYPIERCSLWRMCLEKLLFGKTTVGMFMYRKKVLQEGLHHRMQEALRNDRQQADDLVELICDFADVPQTQRPSHRI